MGRSVVHDKHRLRLQSFDAPLQKLSEEASKDFVVRPALEFMSQ